LKNNKLLKINFCKILENSNYCYSSFKEKAKRWLFKSYPTYCENGSTEKFHGDSAAEPHFEAWTLEEGRRWHAREAWIHGSRGDKKNPADAGGPWIFIHDTDKVERGLLVLSFVLSFSVAPLPPLENFLLTRLCRWYSQSLLQEFCLAI